MFKKYLGKNSRKVIFLYLDNGHQMLDLFDESENDALVCNKITLKLEILFALQAILPSVLLKLERGVTGDNYLLDCNPNLYLETRKEFSQKKGSLKPNVHFTASLKYTCHNVEGDLCTVRATMILTSTSLFQKYTHFRSHIAESGR